MPKGSTVTSLAWLIPATPDGDLGVPGVEGDLDGTGSRGSRVSVTFTMRLWPVSAMSTLPLLSTTAALGWLNPDADRGLGAGRGDLVNLFGTSTWPTAVPVGVDAEPGRSIEATGE